ncbi:MAG: NAD-dependent succinate-semialdehyde dehydrogenase [Sediminimonas qiaohouensis]|uniref:NAD-dependent succinate-semialdehyde dehydrogenase n=1 Tax=Sediminimonas qiaohouensis TaxID=552061 RepID=A0A7C9HC47_9RHOB|nr:NAD-dependent succinate-semialdehyde dehydrogenase [Sediminimonas qiaohouensis]MTJ04547.1 NAD-dependent succinate-semialdehyde dehydrogenase [Sediminimonas qiaohouensis]
MNLQDLSLFRQQNLIAGEWIDADGGATIDVDNPSTLSVVGTVPNCGAGETERAISAAEACFATFKKTTAAHRGALLERWFQLIMEAQNDLATLMTLEQGKPFAEAKGEIAYAASFVKWFAEEGKRVYGETIPSPVQDRRILVQKQPVGVCAIITPWNFPAAMITRKIAPALAAGCPVVIKPSEFTPFTALALGVLAERAGFPAGAINIVTGDPVGVGGTLTASPVVRKLSFTGSTRVGKLLMEQSSGTMKRLSLELGGNAPFIIFDDADLDLAIEGVMASKFRNGGQTCVCANRIYVQSGIYDAFAEKLAAVVEGLKLGDGFEEGVEMGPMINEAAISKIRSHLDDATSKGGSVLVGGEQSNAGPRFITPAVVTGATAEMLVADEETFGPVAPLFKFDTEEEAVAAANATPFGLAAYFYTNDLPRTFRVGEDLEVGMIGINVGGFATEVAPFGGIKESGLGREGAHHGIDEYLEVKTLHIGGIA